MKTIRFKLVGTTPLMLNNPQTVNPMNQYAKAVKELTSKRTKTDEDQQEIYHLKFLASIYLDKEGRYIVTSDMIQKSIEAAAKENKLGAKFQRSVMMLEPNIPIKFANNGNTPEELWENFNETYVDIRAVGIMKAKVIASRFIIPEWEIETSLQFDETQLNDGEIWNALNVAGLRYGIGTYRLKYGRFKVEEIKNKKK